jgi:hypothetical protein
MIEKAFGVTYPTGQLFQHIDGGFYKFEKSVWFADDGDELVIYAHIWPFPVMESARRADEFLVKFTPITEQDLAKAQETPREEFQLEIRAHKAERRAN